MFALKSKYGGEVRIIVRGALTITGVEALPSIVLANMSDDVKGVVVDLSDCPILSTAVINALTRLKQAVSERSMKVEVANLSGANKLIYETMQLDTVFPQTDLGD